MKKEKSVLLKLLLNSLSLGILLSPWTMAATDSKTVNIDLMKKCFISYSF